MASGVSGNTIPGNGTFFVGIDVAPGRYRCDEGKGGWWVRFTGPGGDEPVGSWPLPEGPTEVDIEPGDFAFETRVSTYWRMVAPAAGPGEQRRDSRPVADPTLRAELDRIVAHRRPLAWMPALLAGVGLTWLSFAGSATWLLFMIPLFLIAVLGGRFSDDLRRARALRARRDRYLEPEDLDTEGRELLARAQDAIDTVRESEVNKEGLLDAVDNEVTLPRQEWEIAQVLARQSKLRREEGEFLEPDTVPEVQAALRPLRDKLDLSVRAVTRRVEALERYADRARAADEALRAQRHLDALSERAHEYDELLADAVRDDLAIPDIERLTAHGDALVKTLRSRLTEAAEAAEATELPPNIA